MFKSVFVGFVWLFICEFGGCGIIVNVVVFGFIEIDMIVEFFEEI